MQIYLYYEMMKNILIIFSILLIPLINASHAYDSDDGPQIKINPATVTQGDPFVVRIEGEALNTLPTGSFYGNELYFSPCGNDCYEAIGSTPIGLAPGKYRIILDIEGSDHMNAITETASLTVKRGTFARQSLTLPPDKVTLAPEDEARADAETAMLKALWAVRTDKLWDGEFIMPLKGDFSTAFGVRRTINKTKLSIHSGVDIRGSYGKPIKAANTGMVVIAKELFFGGNTIVLDHGQGIYTVYMHLQKFSASLHEVVSRGDVVGLVGSTGRSTGPHLHYTIKVHGNNANPLAMIGLPLGEQMSIQEEAHMR